MKKLFALVLFACLVSGMLCAAQSQPGEAIYTVYITDTEGHTVQDVMLQVCNDDLCRLLRSDEDGTASFSAEPYPYEVHFLMVPEGYIQEETVYIMPAEGGELTVVLQSARQV